MKPLAVCLFSGGMDSTTLLYHLLIEREMEVLPILVNYGQRHVKELSAAERILRELYILDFVEIDLSEIASQLKSALTTASISVPHGHYADESMKLTVVPNRNAIMLSIAFGIAASRGALLVGIAVHAGDHPIYPDCRPAFIEAFGRMEKESLETFDPKPGLYAPFLNWTKEDIVVRGARLGVPYELTWSCYEGMSLHCGECGTCVERKEAFQLAGVPDPTEYRQNVSSHL